MTLSHAGRAVAHGAVPPDLCGVWTCLQRQTPAPDGTPTLSHPRAFWLQTPHWHAVLCQPEAALQGRQSLPLSQLSPEQLAALSHQSARWGRTRIDAAPDGEVCHWLSELAYQPLAEPAEAACLVFVAPERLLRIGVHENCTEVWERLPGSGDGLLACLAGREPADGSDNGQRLVVAGPWAMGFRPRRLPWPRGLRPGLTLLDVLLHNPEQAGDWLDFECSMASASGGVWHVQGSTLPEREGARWPWGLRRLSADSAELALTDQRSVWAVLEWVEPGA